MKILNLVDYFAGGAQRVAVSIAQGFPGSAIGSFCRTTETAFPTILSDYAIAFHRLNTMADVDALMQDFDICHLHWWAGSEVDKHMCWELLPVKRYPVVATIHGQQVFPYPDIPLVCVGQTQADMQTFAYRLIPNGFPLEEFVHVRSYARDIVRIGFASCLNGKLVADFPSRARQALSHVLEPYQFMVIGDGAYLGHYQEGCRALNWPVLFTGQRWDMAAALRDLDMVLYPTQDDVLPTVVIEAMASGLPVVSPPIGEIPGMLAQGRGFALPWEQMPSTLAALVHSAELRAATGRAAQTWALDTYSHTRMIECHHEFYQELLGAKAS